MARSRVYRHDVRCPECGSNRMPKDGTSKGRQVYHCGNCGRTPHHPGCRLPTPQRRRLGTRPGDVSGWQFAERCCAYLWGQCPGGQQVG